MNSEKDQNKNSEVKVWMMSDEELKEHRRKRKKAVISSMVRQKQRTLEWRWQRMTRERYDQLRKAGFDDEKIVEKIPWMTNEKLQENKDRWKEEEERWMNVRKELGKNRVTVGKFRQVLDTYHQDISLEEVLVQIYGNHRI